MGPQSFSELAGLCKNEGGFAVSVGSCLDTSQCQNSSNFERSKRKNMN